MYCSSYLVVTTKIDSVLLGIEYQLISGRFGFFFRLKSVINRYSIDCVSSVGVLALYKWLLAGEVNLMPNGFYLSFAKCLMFNPMTNW